MTYASTFIVSYNIVLYSDDQSDSAWWKGKQHPAFKYNIRQQRKKLVDSFIYLWVVIDTSEKQMT